VGSRANGKQAALIDIVKTADANTVDVSDGVRKLLPDLQKGLPGGAKFLTVYDGAKSINASIAGMMREGLLGALFAVIVILIFLRNGRATLIAAISIPLSVVTAMVLLKQIGVTLNIMTLGGLTVAIGRVVDDSIVVIENIFRHLQRGDARTPETIRAAASEVTGAITSSTLTTVAVFLPLGLVTGVIGKVFLPFALTVALSLLASLLVAVTVAPLMAKWMLLNAKVPKEHGEGRVMGAYRKVLTWSLDHRWVILTGAFALFIASLALIPVIGTGFVPENKEKYVNVEVTYPEGTKSTVVDGAVKQIEKLIVADKNVALYEATIGGSNDFSSMRGGSGGSNTASLMIRLSDNADTEALLAKLRKESLPLEKDGAQIVYSRVDASGTNSQLEVMVTGDSLADIRAASDAIEAKLKTVDGLENVKSNLGVSRKQLQVDVNQSEAAYYGLNAAMVAGTVRGYVAEQKAGSIKLAGKPTDVVYALKLDDIKKATQMRNLELSTPLGDTIPLKKIAAVVETGSPVAVLTRNGEQYAAVSARITERDSGGVISRVKSEIATLKLPKGVQTEIGGAAEQMSESFRQLGMAMLIAIGAVYLVMIIAFGEATAPLAIMMSLPLAVVGGLVGLLVAGLPLDIPAMIGALMLIGIVVTNAIVLVDRVQQKRRAGMPRREALVEAGATRMRPILMTAVATVMALAPLASGLAEGALISQGLAVIVIGGLTTSTALTLIVVPVAYDLLEGITERILGKRHGNTAEEPEAA
jgi:HAE1 family hydrophobic/amphiphilic exporter-1